MTNEKSGKATRRGFFTGLAVVVLCAVVVCSGLAQCVVPSTELQSIYEEVKTPYKVGLVLVSEEGEMLDNPMVFRYGDA